MFGIRARRVSDGKTTLLAVAEFTHEVTEADCRSGITAVDINAYKELVIRVQDSEGHPLAGRMLSLLCFSREGSLDLTVDTDGEVRLLLASGMYGTGMGRGKRVTFEVTGSDEEQVVTLVASDEPP